MSLIRRSRFIGRLAALAFGGRARQVLLGASTLLVGSGVSRIITIAVMPLLTRLYNPDDFGLLAVFTGLISILAPVVTLRYAITLPIPRKDSLAFSLALISAISMIVITGLIAFVLWLCGPELLGLISMEKLAPWSWLIVLGIIGTASYELLTMWATRKRVYSLIARTNISQSLVGSLVKIALGLIALQPIGLLIGQVVTQAGGGARLLRGFASDIVENARYVSLRRLGVVAWCYRDFPLWRVPAQLLMALSIQSPLLGIAAIYDSEKAGQFGLAMMALTIPVGLLGQSASKALYGEASVLIKSSPSQIYVVAKQVQRNLFVLALVPMFLLVLYGPEMFTFFFGQEWRLAGVFAAIMSVPMVFQFTSMPLIQLMSLLSTQRPFLIINVIRFLSIVLILWAAAQREPKIEYVVLFLSIFTTVFYFGVSVFILRGVRSLQNRVA